MPMPRDIGVIDLMLSIPDADTSRWYKFLQPQLKDRESRGLKMPAGYMFKDIPEAGTQEDYIAYTLGQMDVVGIERAMIGVTEESEVAKLALEQHPDRFFASTEVDPNQGMDEVRKLERLHRELGLKAATAFPAGCLP